MPGNTSAGAAAATPGGAERRLDSSAGVAAGFHELMRADVIAGRLAPGQRLSEASLSRQYGVSRSPVREALASLERDGLIERRGLVAHVRQRSVDETLDIYQVRIYLEGAIAKDAAQRRNPHDLRRLESALQFGRTVDPADPDALLTANRLFHDALAQASHNATLIELQDRLTAQVATLPATTLSVPGRWTQAQDEHERISSAVAAGDADTAQGIADQHMTEARDIRMKLYEQDFRA